MNIKPLQYPQQFQELLTPLSILEIWTDGGVTNNGKENSFGGWSYVAIKPNEKPKIGYSEHVPGIVTNNRCEIMGVMAAIVEFANPECKLIVHSDSQYVVKTVNEWRHGWKRKNPALIKNKELFEQLFDLVDKNHVELKWVKGHSTCVGNNIADFWATKAMHKQKPSDAHLEKADIIYYESVEGFSI
ncbi:ribonuclease HI [Acinetobacter phage nACB2]|nr:ribonuclease HI [Acinetobacter phage nACB2]